MQPVVSSKPVSASPSPSWTVGNATIGAFFDGNPNVRRNGIIVAAVTPGGPVEQGGMKAGDTVVAVNDHYLYTIRELREELSRYEPGTTIRIRYQRYTAVNEATVVVGRVE
jgi:S1-C subfamily serine protease